MKAIFQYFASKTAQKKKNMSGSIIAVGVIFFLVFISTLCNDVLTIIGTTRAKGIVLSSVCISTDNSGNDGSRADKCWLVEVKYKDLEGNENIGYSEEWDYGKHRYRGFKEGDDLELYYKEGSKTKVFIYHSNWYVAPTVSFFLSILFFWWGIKKRKAAIIELKQEKFERLAAGKAKRNEVSS
jgi:hypothetical protein